MLHSASVRLRVSVMGPVYLSALLSLTSVAAFADVQANVGINSTVGNVSLEGNLQGSQEIMFHASASLGNGSGNHTFGPGIAVRAGMNDGASFLVRGARQEHAPRAERNAIRGGLDDTLPGLQTTVPAAEGTTRPVRKGSRLRMRKLGGNRVSLREARADDMKETRDTVSGRPTTATPTFRQLFGKRFSKRGQSGFSHDGNYDFNAPNDNPYKKGGEDAPVELSYKYLPNEYSAKEADENNMERYYYNEFGPVLNEAVPNADPAWRLDDVNMPDRRVMRFPPAEPPALRGVPRPYFERNSCRQYLEFLRYAFEQIDNPNKKFPSDYRDDYYYYYYNDDDSYPGDSRLPGKTYVTMPPPAITPNMSLLHSVAKTDNDGNVPSRTENMDVGTRITASESEVTVPKLAETNRRTPQSTPVPVTPEYVSQMMSAATLRASAATMAASVATMGASAPTMRVPIATTKMPAHIVEAESRSETTTEAIPYEVSVQKISTMSADTTPLQSASTVAKAQVPVYKIGISVGKTEPSGEEQEEKRPEGCHDRLFPCPDNLNVTYPVNGFCNRFVVCESGKPHPDFCQDGLHFNLISKQCDLTHNSFCTYSCPRANGYFGVAGHCEGFFRCTDWYPEYRMCPPRMHWDYKAKICTFQELSSCPLTCDSPHEVKAYNGVCNSYIICTRGVPRYHRCPDGTHFNKDELKCIPKINSNCIDDEDYITRNRGIQNGQKTLCANVELKDGRSRWCQETIDDSY